MKVIGAQTTRVETPILAIHGSGATGRQWDSLRDRIGGARVVMTPDLPGYGASSTIDGSIDPGLTGRVQPLVALLRLQQQPADVVAHSFGAAIALELVRVLPQSVRSLWLYEPIIPGLLQLGETHSDFALRADLACLAEILDRTRGHVGMRAFVDFWHGGECWAQLPDSKRALLAAQADLVLQDFREAFAQPVPVADLLRYTAPVHIAVGNETRAHAIRMASVLHSILPNSTLSDFSGMGHMGPCTHADIVNGAILEWIDHVQDLSRGSEPYQTLRSSNVT